MQISAAVLGAPDPLGLARCYERLLGWPIAVNEGDWVMLRHPEVGTGLPFQSEPDHVAPVWRGRSKPEPSSPTSSHKMTFG